MRLIAAITRVMIMKDIDWDKAPKGSTHYWEDMNSFYKFSKQGRDFVWQNCEWQDCSSIDCFEGELTERPQPKPVYTQAMADNGELPQVGMECIAVYGTVDRQEEIVTIAHTNDKGQFACIDSRGDYLIQYIREDSDEYFKPIDTRTDKEKAFDKFLDNKYSSVISDFQSSESDRDFIEGLKLAFYAGVKWVGE